MLLLTCTGGQQTGILRSPHMAIPSTNTLSLPVPDTVGMGQYKAGDVLLASVALDSRTPPKTRPVVVVGTSDDGTIRICPVSSKPPSDAPCIPLAIDDFSQGGLDLFEESYVMVSRIVTLETRQVIGKKGRLTPEYFAEVAGRVPPVDGAPQHRKAVSSRRKNRT